MLVCWQIQRFFQVKVEHAIARNAEFKEVYDKAQAQKIHDALEVIWSGDNRDSKRVYGLQWWLAVVRPEQFGKKSHAKSSIRL